MQILSLTENYSGEKFRKDLCSDNLDKADKAGDSYGYLTQQANDNPVNGASLNPLLKITVEGNCSKIHRYSCNYRNKIWWYVS